MQVINTQVRPRSAVSHANADAMSKLVEMGAPLLVLAAKKMEHTISALGRGSVKAFRFAPGDQVADGVELIDSLAAAGLRDIEVTSFVSSKWVTQMADQA
jgi:hypothetical protein